MAYLCRGFRTITLCTSSGGPSGSGKSLKETLETPPEMELFPGTSDETGNSLDQMQVSTWEQGNKTYMGDFPGSRV